MVADGTDRHNKGTYNITHIIPDVGYTAGESFNLRRVGDSSGIGSIINTPVYGVAPAVVPVPAAVRCVFSRNNQRPAMGRGDL